jgi:hypothetical protein
MPDGRELVRGAVTALLLVAVVVGVLLLAAEFV